MYTKIYRTTGNKTQMINRLRDPQPNDYTDKKPKQTVDPSDSKFSVEGRKWLYPAGHAEMDGASVRQLTMHYMHICTCI